MTFEYSESITEYQARYCIKNEAGTIVITRRKSADTNEWSAPHFSASIVNHGGDGSPDWGEMCLLEDLVRWGKNMMGYIIYAIDEKRESEPASHKWRFDG